MKLVFYIRNGLLAIIFLLHWIYNITSAPNESIQVELRAKSYSTQKNRVDSSRVNIIKFFESTRIDSKKKLIHNRLESGKDRLESTRIEWSDLIIWSFFFNYFFFFQERLLHISCRKKDVTSRNARVRKVSIYFFFYFF